MRHTLFLALLLAVIASDASAVDYCPWKGKRAVVIDVETDGPLSVNTGAIRAVVEREFIRSGITVLTNEAFLKYASPKSVMFIAAEVESSEPKLVNGASPGIIYRYSLYARDIVTTQSGGLAFAAVDSDGSHGTVSSGNPFPQTGIDGLEQIAAKMGGSALREAAKERSP